MTGQVAYAGKLSTHLYPDCPAMLRWRHSEFDNGTIGHRLPKLVDPAGPDVCLVCFMVWVGDK